MSPLLPASGTRTPTPHRFLLAARPELDPATVGAVLRPAEPDDRDALGQLLSDLTPRSSYFRFFAGGFRVTPKVLDTLLCDGVTGRAFVAVEGRRVVAHAMWAATDADGRRAEIAFVVAEDRRGRGLATRLTQLALDDVSRQGFRSVEATVLAENHAAHRVARRLLPAASVRHTHGETTYSAAVTAASRGRRAASVGSGGGRSLTAAE